MDEKGKKRLLKILQERRVTFDTLVESLNSTPDETKSLLESAINSGVKVDMKSNSDGQLMYHVSVLPERGNRFLISEANGKDQNLRFAAGSDFHFASNYHLPKSWHEDMSRLEDRGTTLVLVAGDIVDGRDIYKGHNENVSTTSVDGQTDIAAKAFQKHKGLMFYGIAGNHDFSFTQRDGIKPLALIEAKAPNFKNVGDLRADLTIDGVTIRLLHGAGGRAYARSYPSQTYLRDYFGGASQDEMKHLPQIIVLGHYHTLYNGFDHGIHILQPGSFQDGDNEYCIRRGLTGPTGLFDVSLEHKGSTITEFLPNYLHATSARREKGLRHAAETRNYR